MTITLGMHLYSQDSDTSAGWEGQLMPLDKQVQTAEPQACASGVCSPACTDLGSEVPDPGAKISSVPRIFICRPCAVQRWGCTSRSPGRQGCSSLPVGLPEKHCQAPRSTYRKGHGLGKDAECRPQQKVASSL